MLSSIHILDGLAVIGLIVVTKRLLSRRPSAPLPPGPKRLPLLGNLLDMPTGQEWLTFADWGKKWGDIVSISIFGQEFVVVNSTDLAIDMLEKRSAIYSDRPVMEMGGELVGWKNTLVLIPYGERFRTYRKMFHQVIGTNVSMSNFHPIEEQETQKFLQALLTKPEDFPSHIRKTAGAIILRISHGYKIQEKDDPFVSLADKATEQFSLSTAPGGFLVNLIPPLKHIPEWFPGAGFQRTAKAWGSTLQEMVDGPHRFVKDQMSSGSADPSFTSNLLEAEAEATTEEAEFDIKWSAASLYSGGSDTTVSSIHAFFLAISLFPDVQAKAQAEIDAVVGDSRLPCFSDREQLPYVNAVALEVLRWHAVVPTGVPHRVMEDNVFNGYLIPKGSLVLPNVWFLLHDPRVYHDPMEFKPERFLGPIPEPDPRNACFGFGRRICPGRVLAEASVWISVATVLSTFNISKVKDSNGKVVVPTVAQTSGTISHPVAFQCNIQPRSVKAVELINA
ncbi:cytochrome P450 [Ephemerocybe angulata]|uniref:Cytochrome P450 n=1 Tax=Ephemerocybe angulata TaxID=980116 RepID=A0A8H6HR32_9AGAR|nr:cytochrome P450 [Tulosesus angulatus]